MGGVHDAASTDSLSWHFNCGQASGVPRQVRGSGPWGLPLPWEARAMLDQVQAALAPHWPRLQQLAALPGAVEVGTTDSSLDASTA